MYNKNDIEFGLDFLASIDQMAEAASSLAAGYDNLQFDTVDTDVLADLCPFTVKGGGNPQEVFLGIMQACIVWGDLCRAQLDLPERRWRLAYADAATVRKTIILKPSGLYDITPQGEED